MLTQEQFNRVLHALPFLQNADLQLAREFQAEAYFARISSGKDVFVEGDQADAIALLISGIVRVYKIGETGREITLYRCRSHFTGCHHRQCCFARRRSSPDPTMSHFI